MLLILKKLFKYVGPAIERQKSNLEFGIQYFLHVIVKLLNLSQYISIHIFIVTRFPYYIKYYFSVH